MPLMKTLCYLIAGMARQQLYGIDRQGRVVMIVNSIDRWWVRLRYLRWLQCVVALGIFCYAALSSQPPSREAPPAFLHFAGNILLYISVWCALIDSVKRARWVLLLTIPFSLCVEAAQGLTRSRSPNIEDMLVNLAGLVLGLAMVKMGACVLRLLSGTRQGKSCPVRESAS
jgi:hypothetical protein